MKKVHITRKSHGLKPVLIEHCIRWSSQKKEIKLAENNIWNEIQEIPRETDFFIT